MSNVISYLIGIIVLVRGKIFTIFFTKHTYIMIFFLRDTYIMN